jgi:hypothetical protein
MQRCHLVVRRMGGIGVSVGVARGWSGLYGLYSATEVLHGGTALLLPGFEDVLATLSQRATLSSVTDYVRLCEQHLMSTKD